MVDKFIDLHNKILHYSKIYVYIAFDDNTNEPWFQATRICKLFHYTNPQKAIRDNVNKKNRTSLDKIVKKYKTLYKNVQGHTIFINESGLYSLIFASKMKEAKAIRDWITDEVLPKIRELGEYKTNEKQKEQLKELQDKYNEEVRKRKILEHDMKTVKYEKGGVVYLLRLISGDMNLDLDESEVIYIKFGETDDMNRRRRQIETSTPHKVQVINVIPCDDRKIIEECVKKRLENYVVRKRKDYIHCSYNDIINEIAECIKFFEHRDIDKKMDLSRININDNKKVKVVILNDEEFKKYEIVDEKYSQKGGNLIENKGEDDDNYLKYLKYKIKYLELKYGYE